MIDVHDFCFSYEEQPILSHFSMYIKEGETILLKGPNGCGKTTLLKMLNGLLFPEYGTYLFSNHKITKKQLKDERFSKWFHQQIGYVFQDSTIQLFCASVEEEISFGPEQMDLSKVDITSRVEDMISLFDIEKLRKRAPYTLSTGEKKKVAIASVLAVNPSVLIFDEPFSGLDDQTVELVKALLSHLHKAGKTMIITSHDKWAEDTLNTRIITLPALVL
ncbi:MAG: ABC transporter ATP-binding protein [bacterium]|nr:ABC transporter ATP-binding protein [bacterium]